MTPARYASACCAPGRSHPGRPGIVGPWPRAAVRAACRAARRSGTHVYLNQVVAGVDRGSDGAMVVAKPPADPRFAEPLSGLYWQVNVRGTIQRSRSLWDTQLTPPADEPPGGAVARHRIKGSNGEELIAIERQVSLPLRLGGGTMRAVVAIDRGGRCGRDTLVRRRSAALSAGDRDLPGCRGVCPGRGRIAPACNGSRAPVGNPRGEGAGLARGSRTRSCRWRRR